MLGMSTAKANKTYKTEMETKSIWEANSIRNPKHVIVLIQIYPLEKMRKPYKPLPQPPLRINCVFYTKIERGLIQQGSSKFTTQINRRRNSEKAIPDYVNPQRYRLVHSLLCCSTVAEPTNRLMGTSETPQVHIMPCRSIAHGPAISNK